MIGRRWRATILGWGVCLPLCLGLVTGCGKFYKQASDKEAYKLIDQKWQDDQYGPKANFRVSDVTPGPKDLTTQQAVLPASKISLVQAVTVATVHNRDYQTQKDDLYLKALTLAFEAHLFVPQFFDTNKASINRRTIENYYPVGTTGAVLTEDVREKNWAVSNNFGFNWLLATGGKISANIASDWLRFLTGDPRESLISVLNGSINQPLLRGAGPTVAQENLTQADRDLLYQVRLFNRFRKTFLVQVITDYYRVLQAQNIVRNAEGNYKTLEISAQRVQALADAGRLPQFEVDQANQDRLSAWDQVVRSQQEYEQFLDQFKIELGVPTDAKVELDPAELAALEKKGTFEPKYTLDDAIQTSLAQRMDLANLRDQVEDFQRKVKVAENGLLPDFNLVAAGASTSPDNMRYGRLEFKRGAYTAGYELNLPLERKAEQNVYRQALIALNEQERLYSLGQDQIKLDVRKSFRNVRETAQLYDIQQKSLDLAQKRVESTSMLLQAGRVTTRDLLESQSALLQAQNAKTGALVDHTIALLNFYTDIEVLQVKPDGFWELGSNGKAERNNSVLDGYHGEPRS